MLKQYLLKAGITAVGLAGLVYTGCSSVPLKIIENIELKKILSTYTLVDKAYVNKVKSINSGLVQHNDPNKVDLEIFVDKEFIDLNSSYKEKNSWWKKFSKAMNSIDNRFKNKFNIDFDVDSVKYIKIPDYVPQDLSSIVHWMRLRYTPGKFDAFVLLTGKEYKTADGACIGLGNHLTVAPKDYSYFLERFLQHELSHLFGAKDISAKEAADNKDLRTIMSYGFFNFSYGWCDKNAGIINKNKDRVWYYCDGFIQRVKKVILELPEEDQIDAERVFCYAKAFKFYENGLRLAEEMFKKYPESGFIKECCNILVEMKKKK